MNKESGREHAVRSGQTGGGGICLYRQPRMPAWAAYGESAYALRLYAKSNGCDSLRGYSEKLRTPCTVVGDDTVRRLRAAGAVHDERQGERLFLTGLPEPDHDGYVRWTARLQAEAALPSPFGAGTPAGANTPKERFVQDNMTYFSRNSRRFADCLASLLLMAAFSPLFLICRIAIKREDGGPVIFRQERIGLYGKPFTIYKFRTMRTDAEAMGPQLCNNNDGDDPRLTRTGRFLRVHHLDELPQLWNVFRGDMSFVGPRPERKFYIDKILENDKRYVCLYQIRPGVTSYATLYNGYTDTMEKMLRRLEYDLYYLEHRSWRFDCMVLAKTFFSIVSGRKF